MIASSEVASASSWLSPRPMRQRGDEQRPAADAQQARDDARGQTDDDRLDHPSSMSAATTASSAAKVSEIAFEEIRC